MTNRQDEILERLLELPTPFESRQETGRDEWLDYPAIGLVESDAPNLLALMATESFNAALDDTKEVWIPMHCWRALAQLGSLEAFDPILALHEELPEDDWISSDVAEIAILIGQETLPPMAAYLARKDKDEFIRGNVANSIGRLGCRHLAIKNDCIRVLRDQLVKFKINPPSLNGSIISALMDLMALDCIDTISRAYEADAVDLSVCGDMEDVEIELGLRNQRLTPPSYGFFSDDVDFPEPDPSDFAAHFPNAGQTSHRGEKIGRNDPCPCGSGKKYKKCCLD